MAKLGLFTVILGFLGIVAAASLTSETADAGKPCARTEFKTKLVGNACKKDQAEAKKAMKKWLAKAKKKEAGLECKTCHSKLAPKYELKADGLQKFQSLGGK